MTTQIKYKYENGNTWQMDLGNQEDTGIRVSTTPYQHEFLTQSGTAKGEFNRRKKLIKLHKAVIGHYGTYFEPFGGLGLSGKILVDNENEATFNDLDNFCVRTLKENFPNSKITQEDGYAYPYARDYEMIFLDWNNYTLFKQEDPESQQRQCMNDAFSHSTKYVMINDSSVYHLRYGPSSYDNYGRVLGMYEHDLKGFQVALKRYYKDMYPDWNLIRVLGMPVMTYSLFVHNDFYDGADLEYANYMAADLEHVSHPFSREE